MSDFIPSLRQEIVEATARHERRRPAVRALAVLAPPRGVRAPLSAALAVIVVLLAVAALLTLGRPARHDAAPPPPVQPRAIARLAPAEEGGGEAAGFGAVWVADIGSDELVRVDAGSQRVVARIPAASSLVVATGSGAVWVLTGAGGYTSTGPLVAIDPHTNQVLDGVPLATPAGKPVSGKDIVAVPGAVWVVGTDGAIRVDARSYRVTASITVPTSRGFVGNGGSDGRSLWLITYDGRLVRFDARTGARLSSTRTGLDNATIDAADDAGLYVDSGGVLARLNPASGRPIWRVGIPADAQSVTLAHGRVWAAYGGDVISTYDPATGRRLSTTRLPDFVGTAMAATRSDVWVLGDNGKVDVVKP